MKIDSDLKVTFQPIMLDRKSQEMLSNALLAWSDIEAAEYALDRVSLDADIYNNIHRLTMVLRRIKAGYERRAGI